MKLRDLLILPLMAVILFAVQIALASLPNIEAVSLLIIVYTLVFRKKVYIIIYIFVLLEGLLYGFTTWWLVYLYIWAILAVLTELFRHMESIWFWAIFSALYGLLFGLMCTPISLFMGGPGAMLSFWLGGLTFDILHCVGNFAVCLSLFRPAKYILDRLYNNV